MRRKDLFLYAHRLQRVSVQHSDKGRGLAMFTKARVWRMARKGSTFVTMDHETRRQNRARSGSNFQRPVPRDLYLPSQVPPLKRPQISPISKDQEARTWTPVGLFRLKS